MTRLLIRFLQRLIAGHGRPFASVLLALLTLGFIFPDYSPLKTLRLTLFDAYQKYLPRPRLSAPVTIVGVDEASLKALGQWPWPRTQTAALIECIATFKPAAIGIDIIMPEPDRMSPARLTASVPHMTPALRRQILKLPDNDDTLAAVLGRTPSVLGASGFDVPTPSTTSAMRTAPIIVQGGEAAPFVRHFPAVLKSLPVMENAAAGQALLNTDLEKGVVRRMPIIATVGSMLAPSLSIEVLRVAAGIPAIVVETGPRGITDIRLGDIRIPTQADGKTWVHFAPFSPDRYVSAIDVLSGKINPDMISQKLVLIGLTGLGLTDVVTTPRGERVPGIEVHAQLLENIFDQRFLTRPAWLPWLELFVLLTCGIILIIAMPNYKLKLSLGLAVVIPGLLLAFAFFIYRTAGILFDAASIVVSFTIIFMGLLATTLIETDRNRRAAQRALQTEREALAFIAGEMDAARRIQMGLIPQAAAAFPGEKRFDLQALIEPARQVGGDLYDFYMLDPDRLFFMVGDVSGKGLPASLFMAATKSTAKSVALREGINLSGILDRMNAELAQENPEMMFVTAFAAILDVKQGILEYSIAGHDAPWLMDAAGAVSRLKGRVNAALCVMDDFEYTSERLQLAPGDTICVITDGITEAMNTAKELYGKQRITAVLEHEGASKPPVPLLLSRFREDVRTFVGAAEQSDDLVILMVRWQGSAAD